MKDRGSEAIGSPDEIERANSEALLALAHLIDASRGLVRMLESGLSPLERRALSERLIAQRDQASRALAMVDEKCGLLLGVPTVTNMRYWVEPATPGGGYTAPVIPFAKRGGAS